MLKEAEPGGAKVFFGDPPSANYDMTIVVGPLRDDQHVESVRLTMTQTLDGLGLAGDMRVYQPFIEPKPPKPPPAN
jgi:hypothetical protein